MANLDHHVAVLRAALKAAYEDGCFLDNGDDRPIYDMDLNEDENNYSRILSDGELIGG